VTLQWVNLEAATERRRMIRRHGVDHHGIVQARVRPGYDADVVDVSRSGALIETMQQLRPGSAVDLQFVTDDRRIVMRGQVVRCHVFKIAGAGVSYRGAIAFDHLLPWHPGTAARSEYPVLDEAERGRSRRGAEGSPADW
jgi:hypothetical protein